MLSVTDVQDILNIELLGQVPEDERIVHSSNKGEPAILDPRSKAGMAYRNVVARILDPAVPIVDPQTSIWSKLRRVLTADLGAQVG